MAEGTVNNKYVNGSSEFIVEFTTAAAMTGDQVTTPAYNFPFRVIDFYTVQIGGNGAAADTATLKALAVDGSTERSITDALDCNKNDTIITRAGALNDANWDVVIGECLRVETASDAVVKAFARCVKLAQ